MRKLLALAASTVMLAACTTSIGQVLDRRPNAGPCPPVGSLYDNARIVELNGASGYTNIAYTGEITDVRLFCRYSDGDPMQIEVELDFAFGKGPSATADSKEYTYWVAVTRRNSKVLAKERFSVRADFDGKTVVGLSDLVGDITVPRADENVSGANFEVLVGFELTADQLEFNRNGQRYRLDAAQ